MLQKRELVFTSGAASLCVKDKIAAVYGDRIS